MEPKSNSEILKHRDKTYTLTELIASYPKISQQETRIVDARQASIAIEQIDVGELKSKMDFLITRLCAICGAELPQNDFFANVLADEFVDFLTKFGYGNLTIDEVVLAFQLNAAGTRYPMGVDIERIRFSGAYFNIDYAARVLENYM